MSLEIEPTLRPFFAPKGVLLVGASSNPTKLGFGLARNLVQSDFQGAIHFMNPKGERLFERPLYPTIADVPDPVDLAVLLIPASTVPAALAACGERGICAVIIASGGFRETGEAGLKLENECLHIAREYEMRLIGPNCIGLLDTHLPLDTTFLPPPAPTAGDVAFISHSGAICAAVIDWARGQGFGLSRLVSLGNQIDVRETDVLTAVAADPYTRVVTMYLEGISDGRRFVQTAAQVTRKKPVLALKVGRFASGQQAVASHTGALAGAESAFDAAFQRAGVMRADNSETLFDWAKALAWCPLPKGRRVAVLTNAGGPGVTAADALEANGMLLAQLGDGTRQQLQAILPPAASVNNPIDMLAGASPQQYAASLQILLNDDNVDSVMVILPPPPMYAAGGVAKAMIPIIYAAKKPVVIALMGERLIQEAVEHFRAAHVPEYRFPERAASALSILARRADYLQIEPEMPLRREDVHPEKVYSVFNGVETACPLEGAGGVNQFLPPATVEKLLQAYNIPIPQATLAQTAASAVAFAELVGYPVALKIASPDIPHKSDIGGVMLNLMGETAVSTAYKTILHNAQSAHPKANIQGITVQQMIPDGQDVIIGVVSDPQFGPVVMFGSGGVEVEGLNDVAFALAPLTQKDVTRLLAETWAGRRLQGFRHLEKGDETAVLDTLIRLAQLAADFPQIAEIEINPLRVLPDGEGVFAVDARARL